jgi:hypothetical protein
MEHEKCLRCHRTLKQPKARQDGYGKICKAKAQAEAEKTEKVEEILKREA